MATTADTGKVAVTTPWHIRPYQPGDEEQILPLFTQSFTRSMSEVEYHWKLHHWPSPTTNSWVAVAGERIIGQYAAIPLPFWMVDQERIVMVCVDGMVDADFRRQGVMSALVTTAHAAWQDGGVVMPIGLWNEQWGQRKEALGWCTYFDLKWRGRPLNLELIAARRGLWPSTMSFQGFSRLWNRFWARRLSIDATVRIDPIQVADERFDILWQRLRDTISLSIIRDSRWVQWRYLSASEFNYQVLLAQREGQPVGYAAYRLQTFAGGQAGLLAEVFTHPDDVGTHQTLVAQVLENVQNAGAESLITLAIPGTALDKLQARIGGLFSWGTFAVWLAPFASATPLIQDSAHWVMMGGDFDVI